MATTAGDPAPPHQTAKASDADATLTFFNRDIFTFRGPLFGVSALDRSRRAHTRIQEQLAQPGEHNVTRKNEPLGVLVQIDGATAFIVTPDDADKLQQESTDMAAGRAAAAIDLVIRETRESRNVDAIARAAGMTLVATAVLLLLMWLATRLRRSLERRLPALTDKHSGRFQVAGLEIVHRERVAALAALALAGMYRLVLFVLVYNWLSFVLACFPFTRAWGELLSGFLLDLAAHLGSAAAQALPGLFTALVIFYLAKSATRMLDGFFARVLVGQLQSKWLDADVAIPTRRIAKVVIWLFALAMAYPYLPGAQTDAFKGLSVLVGLMISLGTSSLVGQAASGLILTYGRIFYKGEYVRIGDHEGTVTELGMFATRIRTGMGEELTLSNATILGSVTKNYSRTVEGPGFVLDTKVAIGYDTPWRQVYALLIEAATRTDGVRADPAPQVFQTALSDWYPEYRLVCEAVPVETASRARILSMLHANIQDVFGEHGVQILSPQYIDFPPGANVALRDRGVMLAAVVPKT